MKIMPRERDGATILDLQGKLTIGIGDMAMRQAVQEILSNGKKKIIINMKDVSTIDSSGVGELVSTYTATTNRGARLVLENVPPKVNDILHITQLITIFDIYDNEDEAVAAFA